MTEIKLQGPLKTLLAELPLWKLLAIWTAAYAGVGLGFAAIFIANRQWLTNCHHPADVVYFSFTTLATVGYGDIVPLAWNRLVASVEAFVGLGLNSILLGLVVTVFLRRSSPIVFPDHVVFDVEDTTFWFRCLNSFGVTIINPTFDISLAIPAPSTETDRKPYDLVGGYLKLPYHNLPSMRPMNLVAIRSERLVPDGTGPQNLPVLIRPLIFPEKELVPSPLHLVSTTGNPDAQPSFTVSINGYFADTGQAFSAEKIYPADTIRCGSFRNFDNFNYFGWHPRKVVGVVNQYFNVITSTPDDFCMNTCPLHAKCPLDIASAIRERQAQTTA